MIVLRSPALDPVPSAEPRPDHDPELVTENPPGEITVRGAPEQADGTRAPSPRGAASPLTWTEIVTAIPHSDASDEEFARLRTHFSEAEIAELGFAIATINAWNLLNVSLRNPVPQNL